MVRMGRHRRRLRHCHDPHDYCNELRTLWIYFCLPELPTRPVVAMKSSDGCVGESLSSPSV